jgi:hypothetical protein
MNTIALTTPLKRGDKDITEIILREPNAGALRGLSIGDVINAKVDALIVLVPRISEPKITEAEMRSMNLRDLAMLAGGISDFFLTEAEKTTVRDSLSQTA